jgi:hypothetical protein
MTIFLTMNNHESMTITSHSHEISLPLSLKNPAAGLRTFVASGTPGQKCSRFGPQNAFGKYPLVI